MKKYLLLFISVVIVLTIQAQGRSSGSKRNQNAPPIVSHDDTTKQFVHIPSAITTSKKDWSKMDFSRRANDHLMIQFGADDWLNHPSWMSIKNGRHFNFYLMLDKPFKSNPHFSSAYGLGLTCNNIYFSNQTLDISNSTPDSVVYTNSSSTHFNKYKLTTMYLTLPLELRYFSNPVNPNKSWKFGVGAKVGLLINSYTKGKDLIDNTTGASVYGSSYTVKEYNSKFFNSYLLSLTGRVGWGNFSINADYHITNVFKDGFATAVHPISIGLTISGL